MNIFSVIQKSIENYPNRIAISFEGKSITYDELDLRINKAIYILKQNGLKYNDYVGVCDISGVDIIIFVLAIIKMGACYVPLKLDQTELVGHIVKSLKIKKIITNGTFSSILDENLFIDTNEYKNVNIDYKYKFNNGNSVYVLYTSGSTGLPKAVEMGHSQLENLILWQIHYSDNKSEKTLQFAPLSFDVSFQEIFSTLGSGGKLVIYDYKDRRYIDKLFNKLKDESITRLFLPYISLQMLAEYCGSREDLFDLSLLEIVTSGDQLKITNSIRTFFKSLPDCSLVNQYGPSETHVVSYCKLNSNPDTWPNLPSIGKEIPNVKFLIINDKGRSVNNNDIGELCVSGLSLFNGYIGDHDRTNSSLIHIDNETYYKTGDMVRFDGDYFFHGRKDDQVKINGYRVNCGYLESVLLKNNAVCQAVVLTSKDVNKNINLIACVVLSKLFKTDVSELKNYLKANLASYMLPKRVFIFESLPLFKNGKVNRVELKRLCVDEIDKSRSLRLKDLYSIWQDVLGVESVDLYDDFFDIGGTSILVLTLHSRIKQIYGIDLDIVDLFTISKFSEQMSLIEKKVDINSER